MSEFDTDYNDEIVCPYCGTKFDDSWEYGTNEQWVECDCGGTFRVIPDVKISYSTYKYGGRRYLHVLNDWEYFCCICGKKHIEAKKGVLNCPACDKWVCADCERKLLPCCEASKQFYKGEEQ